MWAMSALTESQAGSVSCSSHAPRAHRSPDIAYRVLTIGSEKYRAGGAHAAPGAGAVGMAPVLRARKRRAAPAANGEGWKT